MKQTVLITGGAGYIGSHAVKLFLEKGYRVVIFDNLSRGWRGAVETLQKLGEVEFVTGDLRRLSDIKKLFIGRYFECVLHFAALCSVDESTQKPDLYFDNNVVGTLNLLTVMKENNVKKLIFSSTCAIYGADVALPIKEDSPADPQNAYGASKSMVEQAIRWQAAAYDLQAVIFRYFNVCGASKDGLIGDAKKPSVHLMQNAVRGAMGLEPFYFTFQEMPTPDGSPIRDYVDVCDLAQAHYMAWEYLKKGGQTNVFNLGNGTGYSVREVVSAVEKEFGITFEKKPAAHKRQGENPAAYTDPSKAAKVLGWHATTTLQESIQSLRRWYETHPYGWDK